LVLIDFYASWCAPCKKMMPIMDNIQKKYQDKIVVTKVDIEANKTLKGYHKIESVPTLILMKDGKEVWKHAGFITQNELEKVLTEKSN
ncbi:MAG: thioredoxin family protein, partial [Bacteroidales bacterium]|nr:thioredoxin family protein [Bacteroidales bacterium]